MTDDDPDPVGDIHVERERGAVVLRFATGDDEETYYVHPMQATQIAMWLNQAAADAKRWQKHEGSQ